MPKLAARVGASAYHATYTTTLEASETAVTVGAISSAEDRHSASAFPGTQLPDALRAQQRHHHNTERAELQRAPHPGQHQADHQRPRPRGHRIQENPPEADSYPVCQRAPGPTRPLHGPMMTIGSAATSAGLAATAAAAVAAANVAARSPAPAWVVGGYQAAPGRSHSRQPPGGSSPAARPPLENKA